MILFRIVYDIRRIWRQNARDCVSRVSSCPLPHPPTHLNPSSSPLSATQNGCAAIAAAGYEQRNDWN